MTRLKRPLRHAQPCPHETSGQPPTPILSGALFRNICETRVTASADQPAGVSAPFGQTDGPPTPTLYDSGCAAGQWWCNGACNMAFPGNMWHSCFRLRGTRTVWLRQGVTACESIMPNIHANLHAQNPAHHCAMVDMHACMQAYAQAHS